MNFVNLTASLAQRTNRIYPHNTAPPKRISDVRMIKQSTNFSAKGPFPSAYSDHAPRKTMKKKTIVDLIVAHYEEDDRAFFAKALEVLKEFKNNGDKEIADRLDFVLKSKVRIRPKRARSSLGPEVSFREAADLGWIPMMETQNKNHGCSTTLDDLIVAADKIDMSRKEEASRYLDNLLAQRKK